jgi:ribosomal protein S18 acetylase RimI-like enzyme
MKIRKARKSDIKSLSKFISSVIKATPYYTEEAKKEEVRKHNSRALVEYLKDSKYYLCLIATESHAINGFAIGRNEAGVFWFDWLGIKSDSRRKGVGESLMREVEKYSKKSEVHKIWCDTRTTNKESISLLRKLKYRKLGKFENGWYKQDFFLWEKGL